MRHPLFAVLSAATIVAALSLSGCSPQPEPNATQSPFEQSSTALAPPPPTATALPTPEALTDVLYRLADPAVKGADKLQLVEAATPDDAAAIDKFGAALRDGGFTPLTFTATEIRWSDRRPNDALASVNVSTSNPANPGAFTFPMEFRQDKGAWQLSRETANMLLAFGNARVGPGPVSPAPASPASPTPTP
ncbi:hypothetical protein ORI20_08880 [Mycobacterium sp. CVI_P3]|uniref:Low molecular weight antigen MTB12-like C-terminal domain-containing protein n=1 Tax=Mycobacterium pinniadriaticum TaxID=2994102 RepID=A0ABT3SCC0_9MYCO|nr:hypothetical protein [Mycobacterium pinniadriaticum]MCX2930388.1 hypothetical protein [Mycobacterium pinniadriaticum]MCX2936550.1 hypothetical protein [Mycobacterium pinniadriaticum]